MLGLITTDLLKHLFRRYIREFSKKNIHTSPKNEKFHSFDPYLDPYHVYMNSYRAKSTLIAQKVPDLSKGTLPFER